MSDLAYTIMLIGVFVLLALCIRGVQRLLDGPRKPEAVDDGQAPGRLP